MPTVPGQIARVRQRLYLVEDTVGAKNPADSTLVRLSCVDDDAQGQPLEVLWEREIDPEILTGEAWEEIARRGFDEPRLFAAYMNTLRWNCVTATDPRLLQSPFRAGIKLDAYQLEPLRKALLLPRVNLFVADDVGLGKTIEAGLIARELLLRKKVREIVVCCPPSMLLQWKDELEARFGLTFEILDKDYVKRVRRERGFGVNSVGIGRLVPRAASQDIALELQGLSDQGFSVEQLASVLDLVVKDRDQQAERSPIIDLVTTGPEAPGVVNRDTSVVVRELFANAEDSVLVAGYAVYQGRHVFRALADRMAERLDLRVRMFLDVQRGPGDTSAPAELVRRFADRFKTQQWPMDGPLPELFYDPRSLVSDAGKRACLHAKCVVVDSGAVFVSSANFTEAAQERNIEMGVLVRSRRLGEQIVAHFNALVGAGQLKRVL